MNKAPHVLMVFLDGVGIGKKNPSVNPFFSAKPNILRSILGGLIPSLRNSHCKTNNASLIPLNASLGVEGLPQSGTGQSTLLTGINTAKVVGKHFGPYLYSTLKPLVEEKNIFKRLSNLGKTVFYANCFPPRYFEYINSPKGRMGTIAYSWRVSGFPLNTHEALKKEEGLSADITAKVWNEKGFPHVDEISHQEAGKRLCRFTEQYDFVLYEYYLTDDAGHSQSMEKAINILQNIDGLLEGIVKNFDFKKNLFLLTSDHGNIEDLSTKSHTRNPVPLLLMGREHQEFGKEVKSLVDVAPSIIDFLNNTH